MPDLEDVPCQGQWQLEAQAVINDVKSHVQDIRVSEQLTSSNKAIYLNLTTLENLQFCVELSASGFIVVGNRHDDASNADNKHFETPYCLLECISPRYRQSFCTSLFERLKELRTRSQQ
ncbi:PREDICTED: uncharacterized protein LOC106740724 [Dinoponera quadriceps]|uniref:Uncharacterized protein LOC106740724 n=1 Tax=Dinoponera quadriceps TaxID=609295 RepID=A0A6P3WN36_DINQU|nr:PREDICTED: uncharacterized protein LOC106740724 [Dinoponera quadriceps]